MKDFDPKKPAEGLGDIIAKITHATGVDKLAEGVAHLVGEKDCGCNKRREALNELVPFKKKQPKLYLVKQGFLSSIRGETVAFKVGQKILIDDKHPLHANLDIYLADGYLIEHAI